MPIILDIKASFIPGEEQFYPSTSREYKEYSVVFEDDGETGYFYACDTSKEETEIQDAVHIYNVQDVDDKQLASELKIGWSPEGKHALLMINNYVHAIFDFQNKQGCCRSNFPPSEGEWSKKGHEWDDALLQHFK